MIKYVKGDLFKSDCSVLAHGCNCQGGFGSGVAKGMSDLFPESREEYISKFHDNGWNLGEVQFISTKSGKIIANCATQEFYGGGARYGKVYVNYDAVKSSMEKLYDYCVKNNLTVAIPKIGAGLAGGDWNKIESIINSVFHDKEIVVYYL